MQTKSAKNVFIKKPETSVLNTTMTEKPISFVSNYFGKTIDCVEILNHQEIDSMSGQDKNMIEILSQSGIFQEFYSAFTEVFDLPVVLRPAELWQLPMRGKKNENQFCAMITRKSSICSICLQTQKKLADEAIEFMATVKCPFGLYDSAIPIKIGDRLIGYIQTGQVFIHTPSEKEFQNVIKLLKQHNYSVDIEELRKCYFSTPVISSAKYQSILTILKIFGKQLTFVSNRIAVMQENAEPRIIKRAKEFIIQHQSEDLTLTEVSKAVNISEFYFCKMFKKFTGINFTEYLCRIRIERAKQLLLNPNLRISEIAFEVGFQSLTHFNRVFKRIAGLSPSEYRNRMPFI